MISWDNYEQFQSRCPSPIPTFFEDANLLLYSPMSQEDVRWNWEKASPIKLSIGLKIFKMDTFSKTFCIEMLILNDSHIDTATNLSVAVKYLQSITEYGLKP